MIKRISLILFWVDDILNTELIDRGQYRLTASVFSRLITDLPSRARKLPVQGFQYGVNAKLIRRVIGKFADSWGFGF
jgi:hypothetical protein